MVNQILQTSHTSQLKGQTKEKLWRNTILNHPNCPRSSASAAISLATKHDCLYAHLYWLHIVDSPACPVCHSGAAMTVDHLFDCSEFTKNSIYFRYWETKDFLHIFILCISHVDFLYFVHIFVVIFYINFYFLWSLFGIKIMSVSPAALGKKKKKKLCRSNDMNFYTLCIQW